MPFFLVQRQQSIWYDWIFITYSSTNISASPMYCLQQITLMGVVDQVHYFNKWIWTSIWCFACVSCYHTDIKDKMRFLESGHLTTLFYFLTLILFIYLFLKFSLKHVQ